MISQLLRSLPVPDWNIVLLYCAAQCCNVAQCAACNKLTISNFLSMAVKSPVVPSFLQQFIISRCDWLIRTMHRDWFYVSGKFQTSHKIFIIYPNKLQTPHDSFMNGDCWYSIATNGNDFANLVRFEKSWRVNSNASAAALADTRRID